MYLKISQNMIETNFVLYHHDHDFVLYHDDDDQVTIGFTVLEKHQ